MLKSNAEMLADVFPGGTVSYACERNGFEVNGLDKGYEPSGEILRKASNRFLIRGDRREHYVVVHDNRILHFRVCTAMEGSDYAEYAAGHFYPYTREHLESVKEQFRRQTSDE